MNTTASLTTVLRLFLLLALFLVPTGARAADPLNVIVLLMDDTGQHNLGCYGSKYYRHTQH